MGVFGGVDVGQYEVFPCVIDTDRMELRFPDNARPIVQAVDWLSEQGVSGVAVDSPSAPNNGRLAQLLPQGTDINTNRRVAEFCLGIGGCYGTPAVVPDAEAHNSWMANGMRLFQGVSDSFGWPIDLGNGKGRLVETHPTYAFKALLGHQTNVVHNICKYSLDPQGVLRPKKITKGRRQRHNLLLLALEGLKFNIMSLQVPQWGERIDWVDATICALIACWRAMDPGRVRAIGDPKEGSIFLYFPAASYNLPDVPVTPPEFAGRDT